MNEARSRVATDPAPPPAPLIDTSQMSPSAAAMSDIVNDVAAPFQSAPDPAKGTLGAIEHGIGAVMGVVGAPFELMDKGFALATAGLAAMMPGFPAATLTAPHLGMLHGHLHPPSLIPPAVVPIPLPSIGTVMCAGCVSVLVGGLPAARAGDVGLAVLCFSTAPAFEIYTGSSNTWIGGSRAARMTDITRHCNPASALGKMGAAMGAIGVVTGAVGAGASAAAGEALQASMQAAQAAADAVALAMSALLGKDPGVPPALGALMFGNPTVLIGGFPLPDLLDVLGGLLKGLKKLGGLAGASPRVKKALAKVGLCNSPGEPVHPGSGVVYNDFDDYREADGFVWERHYRSDWNEADGPLGYGFRHFYQRRLTLLRWQAVYEAHDGERAIIPRSDAWGDFVAGDGFRLQRSAGGYVLETDRSEILNFSEQPATPTSGRLVRYRSDGLDLTLSYDEGGRVRALTQALHGEPLDATLHYDAEGHIVEVRRGRRFEAPRTLLRYGYTDGCLTTWVDALGASARMRYDRQRRMIQGTDRRGYSFHWQYDPYTGRCIRAHGDDGLWGIEARYEGNQSVFREADGGEWTFKHFADGVVSHRLDPAGGVLEYVRDERDRIALQITPGGRRYVWFYDDAGLHYGRADAWGHQFAPEDEDPEPDDPLAHDGPLCAKHWLWGRPLERLPESWGRLTPNLLGELERLGPLSLSPKPPGPEPRRDALGRPLERLDEEGVVERYQYDAEGNLIAIQDRRGNTTRRAITSWNLLGAETTPLGRVTRYEYTHREKLRALIDPADNRTEYERDALQRVRAEHRRGTPWRSYRHDANDVVLEERDAQGAPLTQVLTGEGGLPSELQLASGEVYRFAYDARGRTTGASSSAHEVSLRHLRELRSADLRDGRGVEHDYESWLGVRRTRHLGRFIVEYDYRGGPGVLIRTPDQREHRFHPGSSGLVVRHNGNGSSEATVFDAEQRLCTRVCWETDRPDRSGWSERYRYGAGGELELWVHSEDGPTQLEYDADRRLVAARGAAGTLSYGYDAASNITSAPGSPEIEYDPGHRIRRAHLTLYEHDEQQRRSSEAHPLGAAVRYEYDSRGQLVRAAWSDRAEVWTAAYDGLGRRLWKQYGAERTDFYWDGDRLAAERSPDGRVRIYVYCNEDALVPFCFLDYESDQADPRSAEIYYLYAAPTGMPLRVEDQRRQVVWKVETLHPYGRIELAPGARIALRLRFAGHYYDEHLELHENRFRDYDPRVGRYLQPDPIGHAGGVNLYAYPPNPVVDVDLRGLMHRKGKGKAKKQRDRQVRKQAKKRKQEQAAAGQRKARDAKAQAEARRQARIKKRMDELRNEGHGPQRHGPDVTDQQLKDRALEKKDPMTGTTTDGVHGGQHQCGRHATRVNSDEAYVQGDDHLRASDDFEDQRKANEQTGGDEIVVEKPLEDIYGPDYQDNVSGTTRNGSNNHPTGNPAGSAPPSDTNFENGTMKGIYRKNPDGTYRTHTMYPNPAP
jgi:RHS repeat-associated protein